LTNEVQLIASAGGHSKTHPLETKDGPPSASLYSREYCWGGILSSFVGLRKSNLSGLDDPLLSGLAPTIVHRAEGDL